ncbi:hypothetical protein W97_06709 [Coniosporium apollinis CBS 100218]|uniref:Major facilitator superfamily (MFS) profile domain-containing protein n=1 Tax=Coniosporium apollinis (strain CBS 100218) TaxID=1168221 RepID=R7YZS1_CONA1|nr:uncharacterized protein W97_06709 [Coniosporium apollinis CBS 100218]EON67455.1 hypothetical protein W97_06709 [Coniosporium apollinis CBS 100218]
MATTNQSAAGVAHGARRRPPFRDLLERNELGIIDSPLQWVDTDDLDANFRALHDAHNLAGTIDKELLARGGRLARDEPLFLSIGDLSELERKALDREKTCTLWGQSKELKIILLICCVGAIVQQVSQALLRCVQTCRLTVIARGWAQQSITGANLGWPGEFGLKVELNRKNVVDVVTRDVWILGAVNSISYFGASFVGAWLSDPLNEHVFGRRGALFVAGLFSFAGLVGSAFTDTWQSLLVCRLIVGIGMGAKAAVIPIFESEVAPARIRGRLLVSWQTFTAFGVFLGASANLILRDNWRWQTASGFVPALVLLTLVFLGSESPRWLIKQNRYREAYEVLLRLQGIPLLAARELCYIHAQIQTAIKSTNYLRRFIALFTISRNRRAALASVVVMASQQLSGINIFAFLAASVFTDAGFSEINSLYLSWGFGLANTLFSLPAYWLVDSKGRRYLLLLSLLGCMPTLLATGFSFQIANESTRVGVVAFFLMLYTLFYSPGAGVVPFLYSSEVFPLINREVGMSWACFWNFLLAGLLALTVPQLTHALGHTRLLGLFAGLDAFAFLMVWLLVPGTVEVTTLEEMNYVFGVPTRRHIEYQLKTVLPWIINCVLHPRTEHRLASLYRWHRRRQQAAEMVTTATTPTITIANGPNDRATIGATMSPPT